jgi:hypothetical protein
MDPRTFLESLKGSLYDMLAIFIPGGLLVAAFRSCFGFPHDAWVVAAAAWVAGLTAQGVGHLCSDAGERPAMPEAEAKARALASAVARRQINREIDDSLLLDFCLSRVEAKRAIYDKFTALKDTARGLLVALPTSAVMLLFWNGQFKGTGWGLLTAFVTLFAIFGLLDRFRQFAPLANRVVFMQFVAAEAAAAPATAAATAIPTPVAPAAPSGNAPAQPQSSGPQAGPVLNLG